MTTQHNPTNDTSPEAEAFLYQLLRNAPAWRKWQMVGELNKAVRFLAVEGIRERHPDASEAKIRRHLADILLGKELATKVYGSWADFHAS